MKVMNDKQLNRFYSILISTTLLAGLVGCCVKYRKCGKLEKCCCKGLDVAVL